MKNKIVLAGIFMLLNLPTLFGQWTSQGPPLDGYGNSNLAGPLQWRSVGIGNFTPGNHPRAALNINQFGLLLSPSFAPGELFRTDANSANLNAWRLFTGTTLGTSLERFSLFVPATSNNVFLQSTRGDMFFNTAGLAPFFITQERMHITNGTGNQIGALQPNATRINISYGAGYPAIANPVALLNLGFDPPTAPNGGQRTWMDVGTFTCANSDNMYVGLKNEAPNLFGPNSGNDKMDAVINWGDNNAVPTANGPDNMRFIFTQFQNPATTNGAASTNGLEVMRMTPQGSGNNTTVIFTGIGGDPALNTYTTGVNPGNTLEVNSVGATNVLGGSSGLRFTNLNTTSPTIVNPGAGVLAVNANGDVIYVPAGGGFPFGGICGNTNIMTSDFEIPMANKNFIWSGQGTTGNNVGIGLPANFCTPNAKLDVRQSSTNAGSTAVNVSNTDPGASGIVLNVTGAGAGSHNGIFSTVLGAANSNNGVVSTAFGGVFTWGGSFKGNSGTTQNIGVEASANSTTAGSTNYGGRFTALNNTFGTTNYGIYAESNPIQSTNFAARFEGNILFNGALSGTNNVVTSDQMFKTNVDTLAGAVQLLLSLQPKTYYFDTLNPYGMYFNSAKQYGLIAQEVEQVIPELVSENFRPALLDSAGQIIYPQVTYKSLNYNAFIAILIKAMQEQNLKIDSLETQLNSCCSSNARTQNPSTNQTDVTLTNSESIVLDQNIPNPFAEQTTITYNLPQSVQKAQLLFYDANGKLIKAVDLNERGKGQINVFANDLSNGIYSYALIADGQIIDTKRMVKTQ
jgi:hypothetical protein